MPVKKKRQPGGEPAGRPWTSADVAEALGVPAPKKLKFKRIATDTRLPMTDGLFVALKGPNFDAHNFLAQAETQGATGAVVRRGTPPIKGLAFFEVDDTLVALGQLARARRRMLPEGTPVVAITGSSGKTSTKEMIRAALSARYRVHATSGNLNNLVGVPLTILDAPEDTEALVVEAGASLPGEIAKLREIIEPTIAVVTNIGYAHVEGFGSLERVMAEKLSLLDGVPVAILGSGPDAMWSEARRRTQVIPATSLGKSTDDTLLDRYLDRDGHPQLTLDSGEKVSLPVLGLHQLENAQIALAVAQRAGVEHDAALRALAGLQLPAGRGDVRTIASMLVIDDSYNANPASMRRAVQTADWLARRQRRPLVVVVGTMLELGAESARLHAEVARDIARRKPALVAAVGTFARVFESLREDLGGRLITATDANALGPKLKSALRGNELLLLKASRGMALEQVLQHLT
jgi:UDP-N-acetylmuramoyl-tripeptide--D-alanyl-D-alanine ligase